MMLSLVSSLVSFCVSAVAVCWQPYEALWCYSTDMSILISDMLEPNRATESTFGQDVDHLLLPPSGAAEFSIYLSIRVTAQ